MAKSNNKEDYGAATSTLAMPLEMKKEFRKICINKDIKPSDVVKQLFAAWIEKERKKSQKTTRAG